MNIDPAYIGILGTIAGVIFGYYGYKRGQASEYHRVREVYRTEGEGAGTLRTDIEYIKKRTDDSFLELKDISKVISQISDRLTRAEESLKVAHKRIDEICEDCKEIQRTKQN